MRRGTVPNELSKGTYYLHMICLILFDLIDLIDLLKCNNNNNNINIYLDTCKIPVPYSRDEAFCSGESSFWIWEVMWN